MAGLVQEQPSWRKDLADVNLHLHSVVTKWLKRHGKGFKPKLTIEQQEDLAQVFKLMDEDGSGAIDVEELETAFQMLGFKLKRSEILEFMSEVDHDGTGELEYNEFLEVMTESLARLSERMLESNVNHTQVPLSLMTTAYKRKKLLKNIFDNTPESWAQVAQTEQEMAAEAKGKAEKARALAELKSHQAACNNLNPTLLRVSQQSSVSPQLLTDLKPEELRLLAKLTKQQDRKSTSGSQQGSPDAKVKITINNSRRLSESLQGLPAKSTIGSILPTLASPSNRCSANGLEGATYKPSPPQASQNGSPRPRSLMSVDDFGQLHGLPSPRPPVAQRYMLKHSLSMGSRPEGGSGRPEGAGPTAGGAARGPSKLGSPHSGPLPRIERDGAASFVLGSHTSVGGPHIDLGSPQAAGPLSSGALAGCVGGARTISPVSSSALPSSDALLKTRYSLPGDSAVNMMLPVKGSRAPHRLPKMALYSSSSDRLPARLSQGTALQS